MALAWVNSIGGSNTDYVNVRSGPSTSYGVIGKLTSLGSVVELVQSKTSGSETWHRFTGGINGWVRSDVLKGVVFADVKYTGLTSIPSKTILNVRFHSQNDYYSRYSYNDCGPTSSIMMMEHAGISDTVDNFYKKSGITTRGFTDFNDNIRGMAKYGVTAVHRRPVQISDILAEIGKRRNPVFSLIYYHHINSGKRYGHFLVPLGYEFVGNELYIVAHDPNRSPYMRFPVDDFSKAIGQVGASGNYPFQSIFVTSYPDNSIPDPIESEPPSPEPPAPDPVQPETPSPKPPAPDPVDPSEGTDGNDGFDYETEVIRRLNLMLQYQQEIILELRKLNKS